MGKINRILVPLDGSELSERALPYVSEIAKALGAKVILLGVVPPPSGRWGGMFKAMTYMMPTITAPDTEEDLDRALHPISKDSQMASMESEVKSVLLPIADRLIEDGIDTVVNVGFGSVVDTILQFIRDSEIDLVMMSTHGHTGLHHYAYGTTADRVARHSPVPVMLVRPEEIASMLPLPKLPGAD